MDDFKKETVVDYTAWDINAKCVHSKYRHKDAKKCIRKARRKFKQDLEKTIDKEIQE